MLATRYDYAKPNRSHLTLATGPSWKGHFTVVDSGLQWREGVAARGSEDPFIYKNSRGYHMLYHDGPHGRHAWSQDGWFWDGYIEPVDQDERYTDAYTMEVQFDDGRSVKMMRRERPWLQLDEDGHPLYRSTC